MPKIPITPQNPHGLSIKQQATINDIVDDVKAGKGIEVAKSTAKFYTAKSTKVIRAVASQNLSKLNFRQALLEGLSQAKILGKNSKVETKLMEGMEAVQTTHTRDGDFIDIDYRARLAYIQEINKIAGVYAPDRRENLSFSFEGTLEELEEKVRRIEGELAETTQASTPHKPQTK